MLRNRPSARGIDYTYWNIYQLCQKWGCTPSQLRKERAEDVELAIKFMIEEGNAQKENMENN